MKKLHVYATVLVASIASAIAATAVMYASCSATNTPLLDLKNPPAPIQRLLGANPGNAVISSFEQSVDGNTLGGWLVKIEGKGHQLYWSLPGETVIAGPLVSKDGENLTETVLAAKQPGLSAGYWTSLTHAMTVQAGVKGDDKDAIYIFFEPFCGACTNLLNFMLPQVAQHKLDVRLVPVAWIRPESAAAIEALVSAEDQALAVANLERANMARDLSAVATKEPTPETKMGIIQNSDLMGELGVEGTPAMFILNEAGEPVNLGFPTEAVVRDVIAKRSKGG